MTWVVDTCVIIDVLRGDETFSTKSAMALQAKLDDFQPRFVGDMTSENLYRETGNERNEPQDRLVRQSHSSAKMVAPHAMLVAGGNLTRAS